MPQEVVEKAIEDRLYGVRFTDIVKRRGIGSSTLWRIIKDIPAAPDGKQHPCRALTITQEHEMCRRYREGETSVALSSEYGISIWTVLNILQEYGVVKRKAKDYPKSAATRTKIAVAAKQLWTDRRDEMLAHIRQISFQPGPDLEIRLTMAAKKRLKEAMLKRQQCCGACGTTERLHVHHKKAIQEYPELAMDVNNCELLCASCHVKEEMKIRRAKPPIFSQLATWASLPGDKKISHHL